MGISGNDRYRASFYAVIRKVNRAGIRAADIDDVLLEGNVVSLADIYHSLHQVLIADDGSIGVLYGRSCAYGIISFQIARAVHTGSYVDSNADIRLNTGSGHFGAAAADFFLHGENVVYIIISLLLLHQGFHHHIAADTIVNRLGYDMIAGELRIASHIDCGIADIHIFQNFFFTGETDIHIEIREFSFQVLRADTAGNNTDDAVLKLYAGLIGGVDPGAAERLHHDHAVVFHFDNLKTDLVHVAGQHDFLLMLAIAFLHQDQIANGVFNCFVRIRSNTIFNKFPNLGFISTGTKKLS